MSYADIASKMSSGEGTVDKHFKIDTDRLVFKNYNKDAVFNPELCSKEQMDAFVRYMQMYGGGSWRDGVHNDEPYYYISSKIENVKLLGISWEAMKNIIKGEAELQLSDNYHQFTERKIAIPYHCINKEYVLADMSMPLYQFINAMRAYYNRLKFDKWVQPKINDFVSSLKFTMTDLFNDAVMDFDPHKVADLYDGISVDYCAYPINGPVRYVPNSCLVGRLCLVDTSNDGAGYKRLDGRFTTNNIKVLIESTGADYSTTMGDALDEYNKDVMPMEFMLYDNSGSYGYCIRITSRSKSLLFVILRKLLEEYNCDSMENLNNG